MKPVEIPLDASVAKKQLRMSWIAVGAGILLLLFNGFIAFIGGLFLVLGALGVFWFWKRSKQEGAALVVSQEGLTNYSNALSYGLVPWRDVTDIRIKTINTKEIIIVEVQNPQDYIAKISNSLLQKAAQQEYKVAGSPITIAPYEMGKTASELTELLTSFWKHSTKETATTTKSTSDPEPIASPSVSSATTEQAFAALGDFNKFINYAAKQNTAFQWMELEHIDAFSRGGYYLFVASSEKEDCYYGFREPVTDVNSAAVFRLHNGKATLVAKNISFFMRLIASLQGESKLGNKFFTNSAVRQVMTPPEWVEPEMIGSQIATPEMVESMRNSHFDRIEKGKQMAERFATDLELSILSDEEVVAHFKEINTQENPQETSKEIKNNSELSRWVYRKSLPVKEHWSTYSKPKQLEDLQAFAQRRELPLYHMSLHFDFHIPYDIVKPHLIPFLSFLDYPAPTEYFAFLVQEGNKNLDEAPIVRLNFKKFPDPISAVALNFNDFLRIFAELKGLQKVQPYDTQESLDAALAPPEFHAPKVVQYGPEQGSTSGPSIEQQREQYESSLLLFETFRKEFDLEPIPNLLSYFQQVSAHVRYKVEY